MRPETSELTMGTGGAGDRQLGHQRETSTARLGHHTQASTTRLPGGLKYAEIASL